MWRCLENVKSKGKDKVKDEVKGKVIDKVEVSNQARPLLRRVFTIENSQVNSICLSLVCVLLEYVANRLPGKYIGH